MKHLRCTIFPLLRLLTVAAACLGASAHADEYGDVSQLVRTGKFSEALVKADKYLAGNPRDPQMRFLKGVIQRNSGKHAEAIATFTKLTEDYPELPEPYNNLAVLYAGQNQFDKARTALEMAIRTNPSYATAHENLGDVYARLASEAYNKALQLEGANPAVQPKLALIRELFKPNGKTQPVATSAPPAPMTTPPAPVAPLPRPSAPAVLAAAPPPLPQPATVAAPTVAPAKAAVVEPADNEVEEAVTAWAKAWSDKEMSAYLGAYDKKFATPKSQSRQEWEKERRQRIAGKSAINVKLIDLRVSVEGNKASAKFRQDYRGDALMVSSRKVLDLVKSGDRWLIVRESTGN